MTLNPTPHTPHTTHHTPHTTHHTPHTTHHTPNPAPHTHNFKPVPWSHAPPLPVSANPVPAHSTLRAKNSDQTRGSGSVRGVFPRAAYISRRLIWEWVAQFLMFGVSRSKHKRNRDGEARGWKHRGGQHAAAHQWPRGAGSCPCLSALSVGTGS